MAFNRRFFLKSAGISTAAILSGQWISSCTSTPKSDANATSMAELALPDFGIQLFSVRDIINEDPKAVLKQIADLGYKKIESYQGEQGIFWGMSPKEFKAYMDDLGMTIVSTHADTTKDLERIAAEAAEAGVSYVLQPYIGAQKPFSEWQKRAEEFNQRGEICKKVGVKFGYHSHDYSFVNDELGIPQEILLKNTDPELVTFELDLCWIHVAGVNAEDHLKQYAGRYDLVHVKDVVKTPEQKQVDLGNGEIDFKSVLRVAQDTGVKNFIVEQEQYPVAIMESIANNAKYMQDLRI